MQMGKQGKRGNRAPPPVGARASATSAEPRRQTKRIRPQSQPTRNRCISATSSGLAGEGFGTRRGCKCGRRRGRSSAATSRTVCTSGNRRTSPPTRGRRRAAGRGHLAQCADGRAEVVKAIGAEHPIEHVVGQGRPPASACIQQTRGPMSLWTAWCSIPILRSAARIHDSGPRLRSNRSSSPVPQATSSTCCLPCGWNARSVACKVASSYAAPASIVNGSQPIGDGADGVHRDTSSRMGL